MLHHDSGEAVTVTMQGTAVWMDTGVSVDSSDSVEIKASGGISLNTTTFPNFDVDPEGMPEYGTPQSADTANALLYPIPSSVVGILVGKVGTNGKPFVIGKSDTFTPDDSGKIYIMANDYPATNNGSS